MAPPAWQPPPTAPCPGDALYPIKRGIEQVTTAAHLSDASQGKALLDQASTRLEEVRALQAQGSADPDLIAETVDAFNTAADSRLREAVQQLPGRAATRPTSPPSATSPPSQMADIDELSAGANTVTNDLLIGAADTLADIDEQARDLCGPCGPRQPLAPPQALSSGAGAATMATLIARPVAQAQADIKAAAASPARERLKALQQQRREAGRHTPLIQPAPTTPRRPTTRSPAPPGSPTTR